MFNLSMVIAALLLYMGCLFVIALWVERRGRGRNLANSAYIYALSLAIYFTSWTFYGGVGKATTSGMLFLTPYVGSMLSVILWWIVLRKFIRLKTAHRIASIADLISARYGKSRRIAAMVTFMALVGSMPYVALQLKATSDAVAMISAGGGGEGGAGWFAELVIVVSMVVFTIMFGVRRLDPTERHEGMVVALAAQCAVKLVAFLVVGIFVTYFAYDGIGDILGRVRQSQFREMLSMGGRETTSYLTWTSYLVLSFSAVLFLPRQFHIAVVENPDEQHTRTAMWLFPAYMFLITLFVVPIAAGGLLKGLPAHQADTFVIGLPLNADQPALVLLVFIGGFSAAAGMMMVSSMTLATMTTNHLLLPVLDRLRQLSFLRRYLLQCKWAAVAGVLLLGWWFKDWVGASQMLVDIGMIAFAAAMQFAPAILGGLFWRHGNTAGASLGLASGFLSGSTRCSFLCLSGAVGLMSRCSAAGHGVSGGFARSSHRLGWNNDARGWGVHPCLWRCPSRVEDRSRV